MEDDNFRWSFLRLLPLLRDIVFVPLPALNEIQISAAGFTDAVKITYKYYDNLWVSSMNHPTW